MGTNFYFRYKEFKDIEDYEDYNNYAEDMHIGKRSAAGMYCWDCGVTLCNSDRDCITRQIVYGTDAIHQGFKRDWLDRCPVCDKEPQKEDLFNSAGGRELGFNTSEPKKKEGVSSCSSFSWGMSHRRFQSIISTGFVEIVDEYDRRYSTQEFQEVLQECPIKFYRHVGQGFS